METRNPIDESLKSHFLSLYHMILSDNEIDPKELEMLFQIGTEYGISKEEIREIVLLPGSDEVVPNTLEEKIAYLYDLTRIVWADGRVDPEERSMMVRFVLRFDFLPENASRIVDFFLDAVQKGQSLDEIKQQIKD